VLFAAGVEEGSSVLVVGAGGVGQFVVQGARIAGAREIVSVDPRDARLELARQVGATHVVQPDGLRGLMKDALPDGVDYAFDAVGDPETTKTAFRWTRNGGLCVIVGLPAAGARLELDPTEFIRREKRLTGTIYGSEDPAVALPVLLEHVRSGDLDLRSQLGPSFALDDVNAAVEAALAGVPGRVVVMP
jgi:S-(hydroxymethyl)glutathione dehydrogenase/alcohol dehydrogenase